MFLSFIIPVYNCEHLIPRCVDSIEKQDFDIFEIILVNDGSKDNSLEVCNGLASVYGNITVLDQSNKGASSARNYGLSIAKGDYVWFVDADDYIMPGIINVLYEHAQIKADDIYAMNYQYITEKSNSDIIIYDKDEDKTSVDFLSDSPCMFAATKVYKRTALRENKFEEGLTNIEDFLFNIKVLSEVKLVHTLPIVGYVYDNTNIKSTSRNRSIRNLVKLTNQSLIVHNIINNQLKNMPDSDIRTSISKQLNYSILGHLFSLLRFYNPKRLNKVINWYKDRDLYPVGDTGKNRSNRALILFNHKTILITFARVCNIFS